MAITERQRHQLFERLGETLGEAEAEVLMEYLPPVGWADVATKRDLELLEFKLLSAFHADQVTFMRLLLGSQFMLAVVFVLAQALL